ncbi:phosphatase PAP2 family protein [Massilia agilis]|uniref:Phosphatase PAP2 family protein n=1 Tax=Massilia agilis TaxID=1811226 RepID=A0ABT2DHF3_9BURK|nr:vanadium-dependent haloperoxidase [Massilia agilis]MCS0810659.1 phosphatase PAP2 family protein [Massilia agilis]
MKLLIGCLLSVAAFMAAPPAAQAQAEAGAHGRGATPATQRVIYWNNALIRAVELDHVPAAPGENRVAGQHAGPTHSSRAMAMVQLAVFDAINAIEQKYPSYAGVPRAPSDTSPDAAVAQAAHDTLAALWTAQRARFDKWLADDLAAIPNGRAKYNGIAVGRQAAAAVLALRAGDGADNTDRTVGVDYFPSNAPGHWRPDPVSMSTVALGVTWGQVRPFVVPSVGQFQVPPPPALTSAQYTSAFNLVKRLGGDGKVTPTARTREQTVTGIFWSYDGSPWIGTPPCIYNRIVVEIARKRTRDPVELARLLALVNAAMADAGIAAWNDKWHYDFWRPVTGIREADEGTGPTGLGDGNPATRGDPGWTPLGAQATNTRRPDFTPPFPAYPSGHASFGGAMFQMLRRFYGTDRIAFSFLSDEWNGVSRDNQGWVRPRIVRSYASLSQAELENGYSRIYLGVHWQFNLEGIEQGNAIADYVFEHGLVAANQAAGCPCH